jgi:hypothetical protein
MHAVTTKHRSHQRHLATSGDGTRSRHCDERMSLICHTRRLLMGVCLITAVAGSGNLMATANSAPPGCDRVPTDVSRSDYALDFQVPTGLMPDEQFDGLPAKIEVSIAFSRPTPTANALDNSPKPRC